jgi:hypothetical protein
MQTVTFTMAELQALLRHLSAPSDSRPAALSSAWAKLARAR